MSTTLQEISAVYLTERRRFANPRGDVVIGSAVTVGQSPQSIAVKGPVTNDGPRSNETYNFFGHWQAYTNPRTGQQENQFCFRTFVAQAPHSRSGIIGYLRQLKVKGLGLGTITKLYEKFHASTVEILREQPGVAAAAIPRLSLETATAAARLLKEKKALEDAKIALIELLDRRGFRHSLADQIIAKAGNRGPEFIQRDAHWLMQFSGVGFKLADKLYLELGGEPATMKRQALCLWHAVASAANGDTWQLASVTEAALRASIVGADANFSRALRLAVRARLLTVLYSDGSHGQPAWDGDTLWIAEARKARNERLIAQYLTVAASETGIDFPTLNDIGTSDHQFDHLIRATERGNVGILGGSPGTGKTFTASAFIKLMAELIGYSQIAVAAPTGKAAVRIGDALAANDVPLTAKTIHSLLKVEQADDGNGWRFTHTKQNPLPFALIVVDESSMIDTDLMASLLAALAKGTFILFVGDVNQLAPVGHGAPLRDMIAAGLPYGELREIHRNDGGIVQACADMRDGQPFACNGNLIGRDPQDSHFDAGATVTSDRYAAAQIAETLQTIDRMTADGLNAAWDCQVLIAVNQKSPLSRREINQRMQAHLNSNPPVPGSPFRLADKIVNLKNRFYPPAASTSPATNGEIVTNAAGEIYVANGELGRIVAIEPKYFEASLTNPVRLIRVPRGTAAEPSADNANDESTNGTGCDWDLAYGLSVWKAQGSEWPYVIVLIDEYPGARQLCTREYFYTAISRAKTACFLIGKLATAHQCCRKTALSRRKTFLREWLNELKQEPPAGD